LTSTGSIPYRQVTRSNLMSSFTSRSPPSCRAGCS
jgi:hypothetical protein